MGERKVAKVTISLPQDILDHADRLAREQATTRSGVIARLLEKAAEVRVQALMAEGYRVMAEEDHLLAEEAFPLASDMLVRHTRWDAPTDG